MLMLLFNVGQETYACDISYIVEVVPRVRLKKIPHSPDYVSGLLNFGGLPIPVVDLCYLIEGRHCATCLHSRIIVLKIMKDDGTEHLMGVIAEKVTEMIDRDQEEFISTGVKVKDLPFLGGVYSSEQHEIQLVLIEELYHSMEEIFLEVK